MSITPDSDGEWWRDVGKPCPEKDGTRIRLLSMENDPCPIPVGSTGTVVGGNGSQLWIDWDERGRSLALCLPYDKYEVITDAPTQE